MLLSDLMRIVELWISALSASKHCRTVRNYFALMCNSISTRFYLPDVDSNSKWPSKLVSKVSVMIVCFGVARSIFLWCLMDSSFHNYLKCPFRQSAKGFVMRFTLFQSFLLFQCVKFYGNTGHILLLLNRFLG